MTRAEFEAVVCRAFTAVLDGTGPEVLAGQSAAILAAADQYAAHLIEKTARPQWRALNGACHDA